MTKTTLVQPKQPRYPREIAFMNEMKDKGISLIYEPRTFYLSSGSRYTPDFYDPAEDKYYELISTRQRWQQCKDKLRLFQVEYPNINFEIIMSYRKNGNHSDHPIMKWLCKKQIQKDEFSKSLGITVNYLSMIIASSALPGRDLCFKIEEVTNKEVTMYMLKDAYDQYQNAA